MYLVLHFTSRSFRLCHCAHVRYYRTWVRAYYCVGEEKKVKSNIEVCYSRLFVWVCDVFFTIVVLSAYSLYLRFLKKAFSR